MYTGEGHRQQYGACALHAGYLRLQIHTAILMAFPLHQWLHKRASTFRYTILVHCLSRSCLHGQKYSHITQGMYVLCSAEKNCKRGRYSDWSRNRGSIPGRDKMFRCSQQRPDPLSRPSSLLFNEHRASLHAPAKVCS
jgi:hypothetical protein